jgi:hypothetical protein
VKRELKLWLKANPDLHTAKHQESKLKNLLKRKRIFWETIRAQISLKNYSSVNV